MTRKRNGDDQASDTRKRKRVGIASHDVGIEANKCIRVFLVTCPEEVDASNGFCKEPVDLSYFCGEDGKIYGYTDLKIKIWLSCVSFHTYADVTYGRTINGPKGITDLNSILKNICGKSLVEKKDEFLQTFSTELHYVRNIILEGEVIYSKAYKGHAKMSDGHLFAEATTTEHQIIRMNLSMAPVGQLYNHLVAIVHLFIEGGCPVDVSDTRWDIHFLIRRNADPTSETDFKLLGFAIIYHFYHYPDSSRLRLGQILVLPPYQRRGHGRCLLEALNTVATSADVHDVTVEDPTDYLQRLRTSLDISRLQDFSPIMSAATSSACLLKQNHPSMKTSNFHFNPPTSIVDEVRQQLKINTKQILHCWEVLIYLNLDPADHQCTENYKVFISHRMKADMFQKHETARKCVVEDNNEMMFVMFRSQESGTNGANDTQVDKDQKTQEEQLKQVTNKRVDEIINFVRWYRHVESLGRE